MSPSPKLRSLAATLLTIGSLAGGADGALSATVTLNSSTEIEVTLSGTFGAPEATSFPNTVLIDFGTDVFTSGIHPIATVGSFEVAETEGEETRGSFFNNFNTVAFSMQLLHFAGGSFSVGDHVSGSAVFTYAADYQLTEGQPFDLYWGTSKTGVGRSLQSSGTVTAAVPEPSSVLLLGLGGCGYAMRRRRLQ